MNMYSFSNYKNTVFVKRFKHAVIAVTFTHFLSVSQIEISSLLSTSPHLHATFSFFEAALFASFFASSIFLHFGLALLTKSVHTTCI